MPRSARRRHRSLVLLAALALVPTFAATPGAGAIGTDPLLPRQWGLRQINAPAGWAGGALVGAGVPIAVVDTGIDLGHEDLRDRVAAAVTCVDTGGDPRRCRVDGADIQGHGTHVAGIAAASANAVGGSGVAPGARLIAVRVFTESDGEYSAASDDINAGIRWVLANVGAKGVINLSLEGNFLATSVFGASFAAGIEEAWSAGWVPVLAAGNQNLFGLGSSNYGDLNALIVGATGPSGRVASSYSSPVGNAKWALVAPGGDASGECTEATCVLSTYPGGYASIQGTSMAAPHAAGAAAVLMGAGLSNSATVRRLLDTADASVACDGACAGRLDLAAATQGLAPAAPGTPTTAAPPVTAPGGGGGGDGGAGSGGGTAGGRTGTATTARPPAGRAGAPAATTPGTEVAPVEEAPIAPADDLTPVEDRGTEPTTIDETVAAEAAAPAPARRDEGDLPLVPVVLAALAALGVGGWAALTARRRDPSGS